MPRRKRLNMEHCVFPKAEQRVYCHIQMEVVGWPWVRERRNEVVNWMPILKGYDDSAMVDSVVAFAVEQPFCPRGACDNYFKKNQYSR